MFEFWNTRFKMLVFVVVECVLKIILYSSFVQNMQVWHYWLGILSPKHHELALVKRHIHWLLWVERIVPNAIARLQTVEKPFCVKGRNVGRARSGDDDGGCGFVLYAEVVGDGIFIFSHCIFVLKIQLSH